MTPVPKSVECGDLHNHAFADALDEILATTPRAERLDYVLSYLRRHFEPCDMCDEGDLEAWAWASGFERR